MSPSMSPIAGVRSTSRGGSTCVVGLGARVHVRVEPRAHRLAAVEARQRRAVVRSSTCSSPLESASTVSSLLSPFEVEQPRRGLAARAELLSSTPGAACVAVGEQHLAVLGAVARGVRDDHAHGERGLVRVLVAGSLRGSGRVGGRAAADARVERGADLGQVDHADRAVERTWSGSGRWSPGSRSPAARSRAPTGACRCSPRRAWPRRARRCRRSPAG